MTDYTYNTRNPIRSTDVRDGVDNLKSFDVMMNSKDDTYQDRLGNTVPTAKGAIGRLGAHYQTWTSTTGGTLADPAQAFLNDTTGSAGIGNYYAWTGAFPKIVAPGTDPAVIAGFVTRSDAGLRGEVGMRRFTSAQAPYQSYYDGELVYITDIGYIFKFKSSRYLIAWQAQSEITFNDNLHILVTAGGMLQFDEFDKLCGVQSANAARFAAKLKDRTSTILGDCYGDSITFGQALAGTVGATNKIGVATGFGDGSTHEHWQFNAGYPDWINSYLTNNLFQSNSVNNYGYSGDRTIIGYLRHRTISGSDFATVMYGVNDCLYATANGVNPDGLTTNTLYGVTQYSSIIRLFVAKQILQGKCVTVLGTPPFASISGFDGSQLAAQKLTRSYNAAAKRVADEFGCRFVDVCKDVFTQYGIMEITQEGTHLGPVGLKIAGERIAAALVTVETENRVSHGSVLLANPNLNCVLSRDSSNILPNAGSTTPRGTIDNQRTTMAVTTNWITVPFFAETNGLVLFVNGACSAAGAVFDIRLDDGALQSDFHFQSEYFASKPTGSKQLTKSSAFNRGNINVSDDAGGAYLHVANAGWHSLSIRKVSGSGSVLLDSLTFVSLESLINSDINGVTARCSVVSGVVDSSSINIASVTQTSAGEFDIEFTTAMANTKYTIVADTSETSADPVTITTRNKGNPKFCAIAFNKWNGTEWVRFTPSSFTFRTVGGR